ncbi:MAG: LamG domain-containing protein, partial [Victivallales bacterium]|nr:LamG domain-containing protein [Victivallales bacterium]
MNKKPLLFFLFSLPLLSFGYFQLEFSNPKDLDKVALKAGAAVENGVLTFPGPQSFAVVRDSKAFNIDEKGGTIVMTCRARKLKDASHMTFLISKGDAFLFGFTGGKYNFSLCNEGKWYMALMGSTAPKDNAWVHLAAVAKRIDDAAQSNYGFQLAIYLNGEKILGKYVPCRTPSKPEKAPVILGTPNAETHANADIASVAFHHRALSAQEIADLAAQAPYVNIHLRPGMFEVPSELQNRIDEQLSQVQTAQQRFVFRGLGKAARSGYPPEKVSAALDALAQMPSDSGVSWPRRFNEAQKDFAVLEQGGNLLLLALGDCGHAFPVIDLFDGKHQVGVFGRRGLGFLIEGRSPDNKPWDSCDYDDGITSHAKLLPDTTDNASQAELSWSSPRFTATSQLHFDGEQLSLSLQVSPANGNTLHNIAFPCWELIKKQGDKLATPYMSGLLIDNPTDGYSIEREFPCAQASMQFHGYYGEKGDGVYVAMEDPHGTPRMMSVTGQGGQLFLRWKTYVPLGEENRFDLGAYAVLRLFTGGWYDAAMLYRDKLACRADWWIPELPRQSTPQWFRDNSIWILAGCYPTRHTQLMLDLRDYFEMDYGVHLVGATTKRIWPHFDRTSEHGHDVRRKLQAKGIRVVPYCDPRLWCTLDSEDGKRDQEYTSFAVPIAIKRRDGQVYTEKYGATCAILCPAAQAWHERYAQICRNIVQSGFDGVYHDQLPCGHFEPCYDTSHGHLLQDPRAWLVQGYRPMYQKIRQTLATAKLEAVHTGEDASEPYLDLIDGFTCWRWTEAHAIPMFQTIYAGRVQFTGKLYNHQKRGDAQSNFCKAGTQFINAEQLGWLTLEDLEKPSEFRRYFKSLAHLRKCLLRYFNEARRMAPLSFRQPPTRITSVWGSFNVPDNKVTTDAILHSAWQREDGAQMAVFLNTTAEPQTCQPIWPGHPSILLVCT